jgi:hypothetical protein
MKTAKTWTGAPCRLIEHTVVPEAINPFFAVESKDLSEKGRKLAYESKFDELIAVETTNPSERFFICKNYSGAGNESSGMGPCTGPGDFSAAIERINGIFVPGDEVIQVRKLEPLKPGCLTCVETDKYFPVHTSAVRAIDLKLEFGVLQ